GLALRLACQTFGLQGFDYSAAGDSAAENFERAAAKFLGEIHQLHPKTPVRLVDPETIDRFLEAHSIERRRDIHVEGNVPNPFQHSLDQVVNVLALDERHFDIDLRELELAVGSLIFVPKTARELIITLDSAHHQDLFELLR